MPLRGIPYPQVSICAYYVQAAHQDLMVGLTKFVQGHVLRK